MAWDLMVGCHAPLKLWCTPTDTEPTCSLGRGKWWEQLVAVGSSMKR